jgi:hypothetical protein
MGNLIYIARNTEYVELLSDVSLNYGTVPSRINLLQKCFLEDNDYQYARPLCGPHNLRVLFEQRSPTSESAKFGFKVPWIRLFVFLRSAESVKMKMGMDFGKITR